MSKLAEVDWAKVAKSVRQRTGHHITATELQSIAEKAASDAAAETIVESHLPHQSMADVVKSMTTSGIEVREQSDRFLSEDRDMYGRAEKREQESEEEDETVRDFYGRNRRRK